MKKIHVTLVGRNTLMMHSPKTVNPLHPLAREKSRITSLPKKEKNSEENLARLSDLEWESGLYYEEGIGLHIPTECLKATLISGAKFHKMGKDINRYCQFIGGYAPLDIGEPFDFEKARYDNRFRDVRTVRIGMARVTRTRPRFNVWRTSFDIIYEEDKINIDDIAQAFDDAGNYVGLCDARDLGYGRFDTSIEEVAM